MIFFSNKLSPRLAYILEFIGKELFDQVIRITADRQEFISYPGPRINYSEQSFTDDEFRIRPHGLLFETGIHQQTITCFSFNGTKAFFKTEGDLPFDIFAASFYLLSRYEEYLPHLKDEYGRYAHKNSLAFKENFLHQPLINIWFQEFNKALQTKFHSLPNPVSRFTFLPTYDIDQAYAYLHKPWWKTQGGILKAIFNSKFSELGERLDVLKGKKIDPYDCYDWLNKLHEKYKLKPIYFFHVGLRKSRYDKNISPSYPVMQALIHQHANRYRIGIHPSWKSNESPELVKYEILKLTHISGKTITDSRQHYIKLSLPDTYRQLSEDGIDNDFSMGYGSINGFRASVASPFYWYDLKKETTTGLMIYPFCFMDANSFYEQKQSVDQTLEEILHYYEITKAINGTLITIWHNSFLGTAELFTGWREAYEKFIEHIKTRS